MKIIRISAMTLMLASAGLMASCGGGGDDNAGSITALSVQPTDVSVSSGTGAGGACASGATANIFVYGGAAPYRIDNPFPTHIGLNKTRVDNRGDSFTITFLGGCIDPGTLIIVDAMDRQVTLTVHNTNS
jgi:hypothetical protein